MRAMAPVAITSRILLLPARWIQTPECSLTLAKSRSGRGKLCETVSITSFSIRTTPRSATFHPLRRTSHASCMPRSRHSSRMSMQSWPFAMLPSHRSEAENARLFGRATSTHGHHYRVRLTIRTERLRNEALLVRYDAIDNCSRSLREELDHRYLNEEIAGLKNRPITTESLAGYIYDRVNSAVPLHRVRLHERNDFFAEAWKDKIVFLGLQMPFNAAHRLQAAVLSDAE